MTADLEALREALLRMRLRLASMTVVVMVVTAAHKKDVVVLMSRTVMVLMVTVMVVMILKGACDRAGDDDVSLDDESDHDGNYGDVCAVRLTEGV